MRLQTIISFSKHTWRGRKKIIGIISLQQDTFVCKQLQVIFFFCLHLARVVTCSVSRAWHYYIPWCNAPTYMVSSMLSNLVHHWKTNFAVELMCTLAMVICSAFLNIHSIDWYSDQQTLRNPRQMVTLFTFFPSTSLKGKGRGENTSQTPQLAKSGYETTSHEARITSAHLRHLGL